MTQILHVYRLDFTGGVVPDGTNVTAMVMYRDEQHRQERGAVTRCPKHLIEDCECVCVGGGVYVTGKHITCVWTIFGSNGKKLIDTTKE